MEGLPHFLLDALNDSITSGIFVDTKLYAFSRREASGRVGSPRAIYGNSRVLKTVPYFSSLLSDKYSEGQTKDISEGFPSNVDPHAEYYGYLSDSDLEVESCCSEDEDKPYGDEDTKEPAEGGEPLSPWNPPDPDLCVPLRKKPRNSTQPSQVAARAQGDHPSHSVSARMGKVAIVHDTAAVTLEAVIYYLYTGKIIFAPFSSDSRYDTPAESKTGDWTVAGIPSPSAKSVYRFADMCDTPTLKAQAKTHIYENLAHYDIVDEVFSSFTLSFPEILSVQVSRLVKKIKEESREGSGSVTRMQLREKIADLSQLQLARATDALAMIWDGLIGLLGLPQPGPMSTSGEYAQFSKSERLIFPLISNEQRIKLALLKSIYTGTFIDVQFHAYNAMLHGLPLDLKPLFTSSIVIEDWAPAIMTETAGMDFDAARVVDGLTDDYEIWHEFPKALHKGKPVLKYQSEDMSAEGREVMVLMSGAWKTWRSLFSHAYTNEMTFAPLAAPTRDDDTAKNAEVQGQQSCSPRSMYSLATTLGIESVQVDSLNDIQSKLTASNIAQELFTLFAANHNVVADIEINFLLKHFAEKNPKLLMDHIQGMASGNAQFFPMILSSLYDKLVGRALTHPSAFGSGAGESTEGGDQAGPEPTPAAQASSSTSSDSLLSQQVPEPVAEPDLLRGPYLRCRKCHQPAKLRDLHNGTRCPRCPPRGLLNVRPYMACPYCNCVRLLPVLHCPRRACQVQFL